MDLATLLGLIGAFGVIFGAILTGGSAGVFINIPSLLIVFGGTIAATLMKFSVGNFMGSFKTAGRAFMFQAEDPKKLIEQTVDMANVARKQGMLALETYEVENPFLKQGMQLVIDGHDAQFVRKVLSQEMELTIDRHSIGADVFRAMGDVAPAMGMIGTLIGLVQMLSNMSDPKSIGPAMAVALLTTLYGAVIANALALPIADKLSNRNDEERLNRTLLIEGLNGIQEGLNPRVMEELLNTYLPSHMRSAEDQQAAA